MIPLALLRHGPTDWNAAGRIQGHRDIPLSDAGRRTVGTWRLPDFVTSFTAYASPLARARETASLLGLSNAQLEPRLKEMNWGEWEGRRLEDLRCELGDEMKALEARGFEFRPPGGESPRDLLNRLRAWSSEVGLAGKPVVAVTHKGVIRTLFAAATGWDLVGKPPDRIRPACLHVFQVDAAGGVGIERMNPPLDREAAA